MESSESTSPEEVVDLADYSTGTIETRHKQQRRPQERKRESASETFRNSLLVQQNKLIAMLEQATNADQALKERQVNTQEKLVDLLSQYFNK